MLGFNEISLFHFINNSLANPAFDILMPLVTRLGSGEFIFTLAVFIVFLSVPDKKLGGILLLAGLTVGYFAIEFLKANVASPRPFMSIPDVRLLVPRSSGFSFPSGHAFNAFMTATIMTRFYNKDWLWYALAALIAFSRVYIGVHYASDVLAGALIGMIAGYILLRAADRQKVGQKKG